jgi:hypothetical protein
MRSLLLLSFSTHNWSSVQHCSRSYLYFVKATCGCHRNVSWDHRKPEHCYSSDHYNQRLIKHQGNDWKFAVSHKGPRKGLCVLHKTISCNFIFPFILLLSRSNWNAILKTVNQWYCTHEVKEQWMAVWQPFCCFLNVRAGTGKSKQAVKLFNSIQKLHISVH